MKKGTPHSGGVPGFFTGLSMSIATHVADPGNDRSRVDARNDALFRGILRVCALLVLAALLGAALSTLWGGREVLFGQGLHFLTSADWNPVTDTYGALAPIFGTLVTSLIALVLAVPLSFGIA